VLTASWPCIASTTNSVSIGLSVACSAEISRIIASSMPSRPAVVDDQHVVEAGARVLHGRARDLLGLLVGRGREGLGAGLLGDGLELVDRGGTIDVAS
jgi:hypothetical protein